MRRNSDVNAAAMPAVVDGAPDDGEAAAIVGAFGAAIHMFSAAIESLPDPSEPGFADRAAVILSSLRKLEATLSKAARRSRTTPSVVLALAETRRRYNDLMERAATAPGSTLGQRIYAARRRADLSAQETANGVGLPRDQLEAIEAGEPSTEDEAVKVKSLIAALDELVRGGEDDDAAASELNVEGDSVVSEPPTVPGSAAEELGCSTELANTERAVLLPTKALSHVANTEMGGGPALPPPGLFEIPRAGGRAWKARRMIRSLLMVLVVGVVGCLGWLAFAHINRLVPGAALRQSSDSPVMAWILDNLPQDTRLLTDGPAPPVGYPSASWAAAGKRWHDFDYFLTNTTDPAAPDPTRAAVWQSSIAAAVFDNVQVRQIVENPDEIRQTREADRADRLQAGAALLQNPGIDPSPEAKTVLAYGGLDLRAATTLAALAGRLQVRLDDIGMVAAEAAAGVPARAIIIHTSDSAEAARIFGGLTAAFRPDRVTGAANGAVRVHWPLSLAPVPMLK
jgi:hypothetical protein